MYAGASLVPHLDFGRPDSGQSMGACDEGARLGKADLNRQSTVHYIQAIPSSPSGDLFPAYVRMTKVDLFGNCGLVR